MSGWPHRAAGSKWITGEAARADVQAGVRAVVAILTGTVRFSSITPLPLTVRPYPTPPGVHPPRWGGAEPVCACADANYAHRVAHGWTARRRPDRAWRRIARQDDRFVSVELGRNEAARRSSDLRRFRAAGARDVSELQVEAGRLCVARCSVSGSGRRALAVRCACPGLGDHASIAGCCWHRRSRRAAGCAFLRSAPDRRGSAPVAARVGRCSPESRQGMGVVAQTKARRRHASRDRRGGLDMATSLTGDSISVSASA